MKTLTSEREKKRKMLEEEEKRKIKNLRDQKWRERESMP
jgi:hypothetical protein